MRETKPIQVLYHYKINAFIHEIMKLDQGPFSDRELGEKLLELLSTIFGYEESALWMKRPFEKSRYFLAAYTVKSSVIESYNEKFHKIDPLNPVNLTGSILESKNVLTVKDIMSYYEYQKTKYYREFLSIEEYFYQAVIFLRYEGKIMGCIGIVRKKLDGEFGAEEIELMNTLSYYLSKLLEKHFLERRLIEKGDLFETLSNQSPTGLIIFDADSPYTIHYINTAALRYIADFTSAFDIQLPDVNFIMKYILNDISFNQFGISKTVLSLTNKPYFVNAVPSQTTYANPLYIYVYIIPQTGMEAMKKNLYLELASNKNLTDRQLEVINFVLQGKTNDEIAKELFISVNTVKTHLNNIYKELNVANRLSLYSKLIYSE